MRRDTHPSPPYQACRPSPPALLLATSSSAPASVPCDSWLSTVEVPYLYLAIGLLSSPSIEPQLIFRGVRSCVIHDPLQVR
ncbi:hypothetical protein PISMIDRAFT_689031 [Pisolithus microcarpus 441]|uniref:Uncharacterized protein n=1 Tax=Pisolithus microcarpus 441 TaxID=765257 RepID=A0A0C9YRY3_9AGAM|nr:hypothetical protein PISMIDRAFT_689031 [Pisolithus microcarpus 441]